MPAPDAKSQAEKTLNDFWGTYEISGVALVDMAVWHWMYDHPQATPKELNDATVQISKDIWNQYYAPVFHKKDVVLLGVYSHMIDSFLYLPDYPIGHLIAFQIEEQMKKAGSIGPEFERMAKMGDVTPDLWMEHATGKPVGPEALLEATQRALAVGQCRPLIVCPMDRLSSSRPPLQQQMGRPVYHQRHNDQISQQIHQPRHHVLLAEKRPACPIDVIFQAARNN